jgi:hypothetical protein
LPFAGVNALFAKTSTLPVPSQAQNDWAEAGPALSAIPTAIRSTVKMAGRVFIVVSPLDEQPRWPHAEETDRRADKFRSAPDFFVIVFARE